MKIKLPYFIFEATGDGTHHPLRSYSMPDRRPFRVHGFTLIEMMVSVAVLSLIVVAVAQITNTTAAVVHGTRRMDADTESRLIFNHMAIDFGHMLKRSDLDYSSFKQPAGTLSSLYGGGAISANLQTGNDECAFYTESDGYFSGSSQPSGQGKSPVVLVAYMIANDPVTESPSLLRMGKGLGWEPASSSQAGAWQSVAYLPTQLTSQWTDLFSGDPDYKTVGDDVFRFEYMYLLKSSPSAGTSAPSHLSIVPWDTTLGHTSINGFADVSAIVVTLAILDNTNRKLVSNYTALTSSLVDAVGPTTAGSYGISTASVWNAEVNSSTFAATVKIPRQAANQVRIYERYFYLNTLEESSP